MNDFLWLAFSMIIFSLGAIWLRAVLDVWAQGNRWRANIFLYENFARLMLCVAGDLIIAAMIILDPNAHDAVLQYLNFGWASGLGAASGFVVGLLTVVFKNSATHPLRQ